MTGKFYCHALRTRVSEALTHTIQFDNGLYASPTPPFSIDEWWKEQIGLIESDHVLRESNLFIIAMVEDPSLDKRDLERYLSSRYLALFLQGVGYGVPVSPQGSILHGDNTPDGLRVRGLGTLDKYHQPPKVIPDDISEEHLKTTAKLARGLDTIFPTEGRHDDYLRLRKGFNAYLDGIKHIHAHNRLHQFVRALDAVIKPKQGDGTKKFKYRCQFFAGRRTNDVKLLGELYELRSAAEHLNPLYEKLGDYPAHERDNIKALRTYQAELLAAFVYRKILSSPTIIPHFKSDQSIDDLWTTNDAKALIDFWGDTIDLHKAPDGFFHAFLQ
jgi:hypothetical protein